jgi:(S)-ureidoglycine aminohydrolase
MHPLICLLLLLLRAVFPAAGPLQGSPRFVHGHTQEQALLPTPGEVFALRKLLPQTGEYDFNIHVMDFLPGQHLNVKEVHYNQHGLLLLQGKGIYR